MFRYTGPAPFPVSEKINGSLNPAVVNWAGLLKVKGVASPHVADLVAVALERIEGRPRPVDEELVGRGVPAADEGTEHVDEVVVGGVRRAPDRTAARVGGRGRTGTGDAEILAGRRC